jgi:hypothetical protein
MNAARTILLMVPALYIVGSGRAQAPAAEPVAEILARWAEDPPEIGAVDAEELALLPWLDLQLAESIIELNELGALHAWDDLLLVPGMDPDTLLALRPFLRLPSVRHPLDFALSGRSRARASAQTHQFELSASHDGSALELGRLVGGATRASLRARHSAWEVLVGAYAVSRGWQLGGSEVTSRSRTAPVSFPHAVSLRGHRSLATPASWTGVALMLHGARRTGLLCVDEDARRAALLVEDFSLIGGGARLEAGRSRRPLTSLWMQSSREGASRWRMQWAPKRAAAFAWRSRAPKVEFGFAATTATGAPLGGSDPISGRRLDRSHASWQLHLRTRGGGDRRTLLHRWIRRGSTLPESLSLLELSGSRQRERWQLQLRHEASAGKTASLSVRLRWETPGTPWGGRLRVASAVEARSGGLGRLWEVGLAGGSGARWGLQMAFSDGDRSILHVAAPPGSGPSLRWLAPGTTSATAGLMIPSSHTRLAGWIRGAVGPEPGRSEFEGGVEWTILASASR